MLIYRICCFIHKLVRSRKPSYLFELLVFGSSSRTDNLIVPRQPYFVYVKFYDCSRDLFMDRIAFGFEEYRYFR